MKYAAKAFEGKTLDTDSLASYSCEQIKNIIQKHGTRAPGSPEELEAQKDMAKELEQWADKVEIEDFTVHRQAFMGFIPFTVASAIVGTFLFIKALYIWAFVSVVIGAIPLFLEFVMYRQFIDFLFPGHTSHNVIATRKAKGETKRRIILIGHADSQYEWTLNYLLGGKGMLAVLVPAVVGLVAVGVLGLLTFLVFNYASSVPEWFTKTIDILKWCLFIFFPGYIGFLFFQNPFKSVPGANDNLTGCYIGMSTMKAIAEANIELENTELVVILSGSEEAGLRGAKAYVKAHKADMQDVPTVAIGLDTFRDIKDIAVYDRDLSGTLRHNKDVKGLVREAGENCGYHMEYASIWMGACDAAAFTQGGIMATGFAAMDPTPPRYYHTRLDNWDNLKADAIKAGIDVMLETVFMFDNELLGLYK
ncbi:MAG: Zn-dependent exopeptidase M28 [Clostridiales bacterium]|nr:Zn-dependent exopeptidase M28 [Clostridiales bacterium]